MNKKNKLFAFFGLFYFLSLSSISDAATNSELGRILLKNNYSAVTQDFDVYLGRGPTSANTTGGWHPGIDYRASVGTEIYSPINGIVDSVDSQRLGRLSIKNEDGNYFILLHMSSFSVKPGDSVFQGMLLGKSGEVGAPGQPHLHAEFRSSPSASYYFTSQGGYGKNIDPRRAVFFEAYDFWQARDSGAYQASCTQGEEVLDAQFKIRNISGGSVFVEKTAISVHEMDGSFKFDLSEVQAISRTITPGSNTHHTRSFGWITDTGKYRLVAKAFFQDKWQAIDSKEIRIFSNKNCSSDISYKDKSNVVFDYLEAKYPEWFPPTVTTKSHSSGSAFYRFYPSTSSYLYGWTDGKLWYRIRTGNFKSSNSIESWYENVK